MSFKRFRNILLLTVVLSTVSLGGCKDKEDKILMKNAYLQIEQKNYDKAMENLKELKDKEWNLQEVYRAMGLAAYGKEDYEEAVQYFDDSLKLTTKKFENLEKDTLYYKSAAQLKAGNPKEALESIDSLIDIKPEQDAYFQKGLICLELGKKNDAITAFDQAIDYKKKDIDLYVKVYDALNAAAYEQSATDYIDRAIEIASEKKDKVALGRLYYYKQDYNNCIKYLEDKSGNATGSLYLMKAFYKNNDFKNALSIAETAIKNRKGKQEHYNIQGLCRMQDKDYAGALQSFKEGLELKNDDGMEFELKYNEAVVYEYLLDFDTAKLKMKEVKREFPMLKEAEREFIFLKTR